jgi:hypothetical protein
VTIRAVTGQMRTVVRGAFEAGVMSHILTPARARAIRASTHLGRFSTCDLA